MNLLQCHDLLSGLRHHYLQPSFHHYVELRALFSKSDDWLFRLEVLNGNVSDKLGETRSAIIFSEVFEKCDISEVVGERVHFLDSALDGLRLKNADYVLFEEGVLHGTTFLRFLSVSRSSSGP